MADAQGVNVGQGAAHLVRVQLHVQPRHALPRLAVVLADAVHRLRHKLQHQVQIHLILLGGVEAVLEVHHIGMRHELHNLQLPIFEPLVLQHLLNRHRVAGFQTGSLEHDAEGAIAHDALSAVVDHLAGGAAAGRGLDDVPALRRVSPHHPPLEHRFFAFPAVCAAAAGATGQLEVAQVAGKGVYAARGGPRTPPRGPCCRLGRRRG
mmetsp:Transcript_18038/g.54285  ORF Transcript_18038/g.54285 Transcript_18038/m.54285 type:complete len:207 (+) Transcript_18038:4028-4648(+)